MFYLWPLDKRAATDFGRSRVSKLFLLHSLDSDCNDTHEFFNWKEEFARNSFQMNRFPEYRSFTQFLFPLSNL